jgi:hypothetical protein
MLKEGNDMERIREKIFLWNYRSIWRVSIVSLLILLIYVSSVASQPEDPIPVLDFGKSQKAIAVSLHFMGPSTATLESVEVFFGRAHGRAGDPPLLGVQLLDLSTNVIRSFNAWNPRYVYVYNNEGHDSLVVLPEATGSIIFPFAPNIVSMTVKDKQSQSEIISVDILPFSHDFCRDNRNDPDCGQVVNRPPNCNAGGPYRIECTGQTTSVALNGTGSLDLDGDPLTYTWSGTFAGGTATGATPTVQFSGFGGFGVHLGVSDDFGGTAGCGSAVAVVDTTPPTIASVSASPNILWPPNHKMVPVNVNAVSSDICDPVLTCRIFSVSSNEPVNGLGDGDTAPDWEITGDRTLNLRSERSGTGSGRIYTITVACTDTSGNSTSRATTVTVPRDQKK